MRMLVSGPSPLDTLVMYHCSHCIFLGCSLMPFYVGISPFLGKCSMLVSVTGWDGCHSQVFLGGGSLPPEFCLPPSPAGSPAGDLSKMISKNQKKLIYVYIKGRLIIEIIFLLFCLHSVLFFVCCVLHQHPGEQSNEDLSRQEVTKVEAIL